jgi:hypothetical protein
LPRRFEPVRDSAINLALQPIPQKKTRRDFLPPRLRYI